MSCKLVGHTSERGGCTKINLKSAIYCKDPRMIAAQTCVCVFLVFAKPFWVLINQIRAGSNPHQVG